MARTITESQYMELRNYVDGNPRWVNGGPRPALVSLGLLRMASHDPTMFVITPSGRSALSAFETRYGITV